jgi:dipeptidase E
LSFLILVKRQSFRENILSVSWKPASYNILLLHRYKVKTMRLLLLSNSTNVGEKFLEYPFSRIKFFLGNKPLKCLFIPYAAVTFSFDDYEAKVKERFIEMGHELTSVHKYSSPLKVIESAEAIVIGGGNTFHLLKLLQRNGFMEVIRSRIKAGIPYIGWSAGANMACPTICTTNDMPIVEPDGFGALNLVPFQINPHYTDFVPVGFGGETRDQRIDEFLVANPGKTVIGLREGTMFKLENNQVTLWGEKKAKIFRHNIIPYELEPSDDFNFLMN